MTPKGRRRTKEEVATISALFGKGRDITEADLLARDLRDDAASLASLARPSTSLPLYRCAYCREWLAQIQVGTQYVCAACRAPVTMLDHNPLPRHGQPEPLRRPG